jgi:hypothetical protein
MRVLEYSGLNTSRVETAYRRVVAALERNDFRAADVKKLVNLHHGKFYRAKLDHSNRLLFALLRHGTEVCAVILEVIEQHAYDRSRFLRGAAIDDEKIPVVAAPPAVEEAEPVRYLHANRRAVLYLDKPLSLDDAQQAIYESAPPLVVIGGAGSGKTALTLEKMKLADGDVLYVTHSAYLAQNARDLYHARGFERDGQDAMFLSYREFLESLRVPAGREASWRDFAAWFARVRQAFRDIDAHQAFEEMRGVIAAEAGGCLSREAYRALGVRQSIFAESARDRLYDLFERYRNWLAEARLFDSNLVAQDWLPLAAPRYDFIVIDEVQDLTPAQLLLVLRTLKAPNGFLLCGDSNQIVHPNFFAWSRVKTLFWRDEQLAARQQLRVLRANFRNGEHVTRVANTLLKIKHRRFGSVDRESNFLVDAVGGEAGSVSLLADKESIKRALDEQTRQSTSVAVLVLREEDKAEARRSFRTPLIFAVHEAKGLEYESIVLFRFISNQRAVFAELTAGVRVEDLAGDDLDYRRAHDKTDKSLEVYKFYVNALYVALTRAIRNVYLIESDTGHELLRLLGVATAGDDVRVNARASSREEWQREAHRLELQGKQEQAEAVRATILKETPVPWPVFDELRLRDLIARVFRDLAPGAKPRQQLFEYATAYDEPVLAAWLTAEAGFDQARGFGPQRATLGRRHLNDFAGRHFKGILQNCDRYGVDHRTSMNYTPLMAAAATGNLPLMEALLDRGADTEVHDHLGRNALHIAMREAFGNRDFARGPFAALYERIAPAFIDLQIAERLVRIDRNLSEYWVFQTLWVLFKPSFGASGLDQPAGIDTEAVLNAWASLPPSVLKPRRNKRSHLSNVLSRNEVEREYAYNRKLFKRIAHGWYQINPQLAIRHRHARGESWQSVLKALNLPLVHELAHPDQWGISRGLWRSAGGEELPIPVAAEAWDRRERALIEAEQAAIEAAATRRRAAEEKRQHLDGELRNAPPQPPPPRWGTPEAKRAAREELQRRIAAQRKARGTDEQ